MIILPAIDIKDSKAVRLTQGDYNKITVYSDNPLDFAYEFCSKGAEYLHIVDLNGAKEDVYKRQSMWNLSGAMLYCFALSMISLNTSSPVSYTHLC